MKYTFTKADGSKKTVEIADEWLAKTRRALNISSSEAINLWLCDNDYITDEEQQALNQKATAANAGMRVQAKERKKPTRKPDDLKRMLIAGLAKYMSEAYDEVKNVEVTNIERMIAFSIGDDQYEITLTKKRKPKA